MDDVTALYRELDPLRPLTPAEDDLYVDWQRQLDPEGRDAKSRLIQTFRRNASPEHPITRLLTGHRGCGKTTELNRVRDALSSGRGGSSKIFVSTLFAGQWLDLEDVQPEDLVLQIVRQLVADLHAAGVPLGAQKFKGLFGSLVDRVKGTRLEKVNLGVDPLTFSFTFEHFPTARDEFRELLRAQLSTVFDLVNSDLLPSARRELALKGFSDVLLIVDDLDRIPQRVLLDGGVTNHHSLFLDGSKELRSINCSMLLTVPLELAYSPAHAALKNTYGGAMHTLPLLPVVGRDGAPIAKGHAVLVEIIGRRAQRAFGTPASDPHACAARIFSDKELLGRVVRLSGGHLRSLLVIVSELLDWIEELPVGPGAVDRYVSESARNFDRPLRPSDRELLRRVAADGRSPEEPRFFELLRNMYVFAYGSEDGDWYGLNPLLREIEL